MRYRRGYKRRRSGRRYRRRLYRRGRRYGRRRSYRRRRLGFTRIKASRTLADTAFVKFHYTERVDLTSQNVTSYNYFVFRGNSVYDPNFTGGGHQPTGYDQWTAFYLNYCVYASKISVSFNSGDGTETDSIVAYVFPDTSSSYPGPTVVLEENPYVRYRFLQTEFQAPKSSRTIRNFMTTKKMWGRNVGTDLEYFGAAYNSNPAYPWFWQIVLLNPYQVLTPHYHLHVRITYYTKLYTRINPMAFS